MLKWDILQGLLLPYHKFILHSADKRISQFTNKRSYVDFLGQKEKMIIDLKQIY
jgi:hypothetical protein